MTTQTKVFYPRTVTQTTGGKYAKFNDLNVIKATNNGYAQTNKIESKKKTEAVRWRVDFYRMF